MKLKKKLLWSFVALALAVLTIWAVLGGSGMSADQILAGVRGAKKRWLIFAVLSMLGIIYFEGRAVLAILRHAGYQRSPRQGFVYAAADVYFSAITPSATGGQPASAFFMMRDQIPGAVVTAALLVNLVMYNAAILVIGAFSLITRPQIFLNYQPWCRVLIVLGILVLLGMGFLFFALLWRQETLFRVAIWGIGLLHRIRLMRHPERWQEKLRKTMQEYKDCVRLMAGQRRMWFLAFCFNVLQRISQFTVAVFVYLAIGGKAAALFDLWVTQCYVSLGSNCIPIPGSMGVTDYLMLDGYMNLMDRADAFRLQLLTRGLSFYCCIIISGITVLAAYLLRRRNRTDIGHM